MDVDVDRDGEEDERALDERELAAKGISRLVCFGPVKPCSPLICQSSATSVLQLDCSGRCMHRIRWERVGTASGQRGIVETLP